MRFLAQPYLELIWRSPSLRRGALICVALASVSAAAEIAVAMSLVPILTSLGVAAGTDLSGFVGSIPAGVWLVLFALAAALRSLSNWLSTVQDERSTQELVISLQSRLYRALAGAHWDAVRRLAPPTITSALQTQTYDAGYGFSSIIQVTTAALLVIGYVASAAWVFPLILPVLLLLLAFMWWINASRSDRVLAHSEDYHEAQTELHQRYEDWVAIGRIASLGVDTNKLAERFETGARDAAAHAVGYSRSSAATRIRYEAAVVMAILVGVPVAWWLETPPALLAFGLVLIVRVLPRAGSIQSGYQGVINAVAPVRSIERLAAQLELDSITPPARNVVLDWQNLQLTNVGIEDAQREHGRRWLLNGADLDLQHGEWLALNGATGAGKTTLAEIMLMLIRPDSGELRIDGNLVDDALACQWREQAAYVPQDVILFDATIRDNLRLYVPDATDEELFAAI